MYNRKSQVSTEIEGLDNISLLERICNENCNESYIEFVNRFYDDVFDECRKKCKSRNIDLHVGRQIAHEVFERVKKYKSFDRTKLKNAKDERKAILGWLYRFLINLFYDHHNSQKNEEVEINSYFDDLIGTASEINPEKLATTRDLSVKILGKLNAKEKKVVLTDLEYKRSQKYLPDHVNEKLAQELGVKKATVRKIRERAVKKIKLALDEINQ